MWHTYTYWLYYEYTHANHVVTFSDNGHGTIITYMTTNPHILIILTKATPRYNHTYMTTNPHTLIILTKATPRGNHFIHDYKSTHIDYTNQSHPTVQSLHTWLQIHEPSLYTWQSSGQSFRKSVQKIDNYSEKASRWLSMFVLTIVRLWGGFG